MKQKNKSLISILFFILFFQSTQLNAESIKIKYRNEMRWLVELISQKSRKLKTNFIIVPQNALELISYNGKHDGKIINSYLSAIDGVGCEELYYGNIADGIKNPSSTTHYFRDYLLTLKKHGKTVFVIDYVKNSKQAYDSYKLCQSFGFLSFQAKRPAATIPENIFNINDSAINKISEAKNYLYILNGARFKSPGSYIRSLKKSKSDLFIIDAFFWKKILTRKQLGLIQKKPSGKKRLVLAYLSIGEAEDYRYYWKKKWKQKPPAFLDQENPEWRGNYKVKYWMKDWKEIICGKSDGTGFEKSYLKKIINAGFDGVYLDILDAAIYFEKEKP